MNIQEQKEMLSSPIRTDGYEVKLAKQKEILPIVGAESVRLFEK